MQVLGKIRIFQKNIHPCMEQEEAVDNPGSESDADEHNEKQSKSKAKAK